jgi:hypothetical protein
METEPSNAAACAPPLATPSYLPTDSEPEKLRDDEAMAGSRDANYRAHSQKRRINTEKKIA